MPIQYKNKDQIKNYDDLFRIKNNNFNSDYDYDFEIKLTWQSYGFYEPFCIVFLSALPCTPPFIWMIGARVLDKNGVVVKDYVVNESAYGVYWLAFLNPYFWKQQPLAEQLLDNVLKNLFLEIQKDG